MPANRSFTELPHTGEQNQVVTPVTQNPEPDYEETLKSFVLIIMIIIPIALIGIIFLVGNGLVR